MSREDFFFSFFTYILRLKPSLKITDYEKVAKPPPPPLTFVLSYFGLPEVCLFQASSLQYQLQKLKISFCFIVFMLKNKLESESADSSESVG